MTPPAMAPALVCREEELASAAFVGETAEGENEDGMDDWRVDDESWAEVGENVAEFVADEDEYVVVRAVPVVVDESSLSELDWDIAVVRGLVLELTAVVPVG